VPKSNASQLVRVSRSTKNTAFSHSKVRPFKFLNKVNDDMVSRSWGIIGLSRTVQTQHHDSERLPPAAAVTVEGGV
jgi:hypothetical protein